MFAWKKIHVGMHRIFMQMKAFCGTCINYLSKVLKLTSPDVPTLETVIWKKTNADLNTNFDTTPSDK